jgi:hypothetical protein
MKNRRSAHTGTPARHVPPSGFGYPLGGLLPSIPRRFFFTPAALLGFTLRSVSLSKGIRGHYSPDEPTYRSACRCSRRRSVGPAQQAPVPGFQPFRESLATGQRVSSPSCRMLPWVSALLGFPTGSLVQAFTRTPLSHFKRQTTNRLTPCAPEYRSTPGQPYPYRRSKLQRSDKVTLLGFLHRLNPVHSRDNTPWLWVHLSLCRALLPTNQ